MKLDGDCERINHKAVVELTDRQREIIEQLGTIDDDTICFFEWVPRPSAHMAI